MVIKQLLLSCPTFPDAPSRKAFEGAAFLARTLEARLTVLIPQLSTDPAAWPAMVGTFPLDFPQMMNEAVHASEQNAAKATVLAQQVCTEWGVRLDMRRSLTTLYESAGPLVDLARLHDLTLLPYPECESFSRHALEAAIFETGRPTLLLPSGKGIRPLGKLGNVLLAWDFSRSAARALADSLPLLVRARQVHVLSVLGEKGIQTTAGFSDLEQYLGSHGVQFVRQEKRINEGTIGDFLAAQAKEIDADLLVMGAYGHSRLLEFVLGGATRGILSSPALPIFLSH